MTKIAVIGNGGGGKTTLSRKLAQIHGLPLTHVDSIQFLEGMKVRPVAETTQMLDEIAARDRWIIDGFGTFDVMERRFRRADQVVFVDFPIWRHYWWATKRQVKAFWKPRDELPPGCDEASFMRTMELYRTLWRVHRMIRPKLVELFSKPEIAPKVAWVRGLQDWNRMHAGHA